MIKKIEAVLTIFLAILLFSCDQPNNPTEDETKDNEPSKSANELIAEGQDLIKSGDWDLALTIFEEAMDKEDAPAEATLWYAFLLQASVSIDPNVVEVMNNLGLDNYPTNLKELYGEIDGAGTSQSEGVMSILPDFLTTIRNSDKFEKFSKDTYFSTDGEIIEFDTGHDKLLAILYNLSENYPNGFNPVIDSFVKSSQIFDQVVLALDKLNDDVAFELTYDLFYSEEFTESSIWPSETSEDGGTTPMIFKAGKGEIYALLANLELTRSLLLMVQSVSLSADLDGYWDLFNPLDGSLWIYDEDDMLKINPDFDWSKISNPFKDQFLYAREDAPTILADSKVHFTNSMDYIKKSYGLIASRTDTSDFYLSPANPLISDSQWEIVEKGEPVVSKIADKIIDSANNGAVIYFPDITTTNPEVLDFLADEANWPDEGMGINLKPMFEKPLLSLDNILEITDQGEFKFYTLADDEYVLITNDNFDQADGYYLRIKDVTLGGTLVGFDAGLILPLNLDDSYIPLNSPSALTIGHSVTPKGEEFSYKSSDGTPINVISKGTMVGEHFLFLFASTLETSGGSMPPVED